LIKLHDDQAEFVRDIRKAWWDHRSVMGVLPTGGGKTICFSSIVRDHGGYAGVVVHRREIIKQISLSLGAFDIKHRIVAPPAVVAIVRRAHMKKFGKSFVDPHALVGVASAQTLASKSTGGNQLVMRWINQCDLAVFDEGHHYVGDGSWGKAVRLFDHAERLLFVSASPDRADGKPLSFCDVLVEGQDTQWLIDHGRLSPFKYYAPESNLGVDDIPLTASGDFNSRAFRAQVVESDIVGDVVAQYLKLAKGKKAIVFATDVETAFDMAEAFKAQGVRALALHGGTDSAEREKGLELFEGSGYDVLVNVDLFDEGFDVPSVECVIQARPTMSIIKFLQQCGRALRVLKGKEYAILIDMVRNWERHGLPSFPRTWTLDGRAKGEGKERDAEPLSLCLSCTQPFPSYLKACTLCGAERVPAGRSSPGQVDGDLFELDVAALQALFKKIDAANLSDADYQRDQIARNIPEIGRSQDLKRYQAAKYRRLVLENLIGWWVGSQPKSRELAEIQRRFYARMGIDMATAKTLNAKDTDALIKKLEINFTKDLR
jgi:DNA repair protein RadD